MSSRLFGTLGERPVREVVISSGQARASIIEYGAVVRDLEVQLADGTWQRVVLGLETLADYVAHSPHFGAIPGRYANRIAGGRFVLDGAVHHLPLNQAGKHSLHGGGEGFGKRCWTILSHDESSVTLGLVSPAGEAGYPGALTATCRYMLAGAALRIELMAITDAPTVVNLCNHSYFNLDGSADILDHQLSVRANLMTPVDADLIPDGSLAPVSGTPFDFRVARPIGQAAADGARFWYDHNFVLRRDRREVDRSGLDLAQAAVLSSPKSGLSMETWTTAPCMQLYDSAKMNVPVPGLGGAAYGPCAGLCLETQAAPDSPNLPHLPSTVLRPGEVYRHITEYRFSARR